MEYPYPNFNGGLTRQPLNLGFDELLQPIVVYEFTYLSLS